jgi:6-phosphogluconolactonase
MTANSICLREFETAEDLAEATAQEILQLVKSVNEGPTGILLSGGRTPLAAYEIVARTSTPASGNLHVFFSDERMLPFDSPENNSRNAGSLIESLEIPDENVQRVNTALPLDEAAAGYDRELEDFLSRGGKIPLGLLGLGADGHTASLFSREDVERGATRLALGIRREEGPCRVSVTSTLLSRVGGLLFLVSGREKEEIVRTLQERPSSIPAGLAIRSHPNVRVWHALER